MGIGSSEFKPNESELSISEENFTVFSINYTENETNLNKIKDSIDLIGNKYINNKNIKFIEKEYKNLIHRSDEGKIYSTLHKGAKEIKKKLNENEDFKEIKKDVKKIFKG